MNKHNKNILKENVKKLIFKKKEFKTKIFKSIIHNNYINNILRSYTYFLNNSCKLKKSLSKQHSICLKTGKRRSVGRLTNISRQELKRHNIEGRLQNIKILNW